MACKKSYWAFAFGIGLAAVVIGLLGHSSFCIRSASLPCRLQDSAHFYNIAWGLKRFFPAWPKLPFPIRGQKDRNVFPLGLLWMAPFLSGGGYCSEALSYVLGLAASGLVPNLSIEQHGDLADEAFWRGLPSSTKRLLIHSYNSRFPLNGTVVICHSEPGAWYPPLFETTPCPPTGYKDSFYIIGRTMFETDRMSAEHVQRCNRMDEVWVPSDFNRETFARSGVDPSKLVKVVQPVDVWFFDPEKVKPVGLPIKGRHVFWGKISKQNLPPKNCFVFLSVFKWELRKGWDLLIQAYMKEFSGNDNVMLFVSTSAYHSDTNYEDEVVGLLRRVGLQEPEKGWPALLIDDGHIPQVDLPKMYRSSNAFVLASRGEGWGRPHVEAMSMGLPVIATNWSGMREYMTEANSYPLPVERLVEIQEGAFKGHLWAEPSIASLQNLMRHVFMHPSEAKLKGKLARHTMVTRFSPEVVTRDVLHHLLRISQKRHPATLVSS